MGTVINVPERGGGSETIMPDLSLRNGHLVLGSWTSAILAGGASVSTSDVDVKYNSTGSLKIIGNSGTTCSGYKAISPLWPAARKCKTVVFRAKCIASNPKPLQIRLYNSALTKFVNAQVGIPSDGDWHTLSLDEFSLTPANGFIFGTDEIGFIQFREERSVVGQLTPLATDGSEYILIGPQWFERGTRAKFMFTFDDSQLGLITPNIDAPVGYPESGTTVKDILASYGFTGTAYAIPNYFGNPGYETAESMLDLQASGWDIASHSQASETGQIGNSAHGLRTIGTFGLGPFNISAVAANVLTITGHPFATSKVTVGGSVAPAGLTLGVEYWTRNLSSNTVTLHPTRLDANNNTNVIPVTTSGTGAFLRWFDAVGVSAITSTVAADTAVLRGYGFKAWEHYALPQGGWDNEVLASIQSLGLKTVRGVDASRPYIMGIHKAGIAASLPAHNWLHDPIHVGACVNISANDTATVQSYIDRAIYCGGTTGIYGHALTASDAVKLDAVASYLRTKVAAGVIDVVTISQWHKQLSDVCNSIAV